MNSFLKVLIASFFVVLITPSISYAKVSCFCQYSCTFGDNSSYTNSEAFWKRPNGRNFNQPVSNDESDDCKSYCQTKLEKDGIAELANERKACGSYICTGTSKVGNSQKSIRNVSLSGNHKCERTDSGSEPMAKVEYQYSSKIMCGSPERDRIVLPGVFQSAVNIHNPQYEDVLYRRKVARAGFAEDGDISAFIHGKIGPDGVQVFDCNIFEEQLQPNSSLTDGYFVIESKAPLDVTTYYTGSHKQALVALDVEKTTEREVEEKEWLCDGSSNVMVDLGDASNWLKSDGNNAHRVVSPHSSWDGGREWISLSNNGSAPENTVSKLTLDVCNCSRKTRARVNIESDRVDDSIKMYFSSNASNSASQTSSSTSAPVGHLALNLNQTPTSALHTNIWLQASLPQGNNRLNLDIRNGVGPAGVSFHGANLIIDEAYIGMCRH